MTKIDKHIEIVRSGVLRLSSMSQASADAIYKVLAAHYETVGITTVNDLSDLDKLVTKRPDAVFLGMKHVMAEGLLGVALPGRIWLAAYLGRRGIGVTGSAQTAHRLELDKSLAKLRAQSAGLPTPGFFVAKRGKQLQARDITLNFPLFVKPLDRGGGLGIDSDSVVHNFEQLISKVDSLAERYNADALIEEYLPGREFSVALLANPGGLGYSVMPIELIAPADARGERLLSAQVKTADAESFLAVEDGALKTKIENLAANMFEVLGARDYGRIDIRLDAHGEPHFLEANLLPSLIEGYGSFPKACGLHLGMNHEQVILRIAGFAVERSSTLSEEFSWEGFSPAAMPVNYL